MGNVIVEIIGREAPIKFKSNKAHFRNGAVAEGDVRIDRKLSDGCCNTVTSIDAATMNVPEHGTSRGAVLLEGNVQIEFDGRIFKTERATMSRRSIRMDMVEVVQQGLGETTPAP